MHLGFVARVAFALTINADRTRFARAGPNCIYVRQRAVWIPRLGGRQTREFTNDWTHARFMGERFSAASAGF